MHLAIVHLTDLHVQSGQDPIVTRAQAIAAAIRPRVAQANAVILAVTGDLSNSGEESELLDASGFIDELRAELANRTAVETCVAIIPGNHDCDFSGTGDLRRLVLEGISAASEVSDEVIGLLVGPQSQFFEIRDEFFPPTTDTSPLAWSYELEFGRVSALIRCLNTAWCSSLHEVQGKLFFPPANFPDDSTDGYDLVITLLHHPTPWMESTNGRILRDYLEESADLVLTGHDHVADQRFVTKTSGQSIQYIEGVALQDARSTDTGFNLIDINLLAKHQRLWTFLWDSRDEVYVPVNEQPSSTDLQVNRARKRKEFHVIRQFQDYLDDLGLEVTHPNAGVLTRSQVFKYPQLRRIRVRDGKTAELLGAKDLISAFSERRLVLITGDEEAGKTTLAKQFFEDLLRTGLVPVYLRADRAKRRDFRSPSSVDRLIDAAVDEQYGSSTSERYRQLDLDQRAIIIDDYHKAQISPDSLNAIIVHLLAGFGKVYLFSDAMSQELRRLEMNGMGSLERRRDTAHFSIQPFGFRRRNSMVEQWVSLNPDHATDVGELVRQTESRNRILDTVIGKNLVPAFPVYILGVLQASESVGAVDLRASVNAHYYELFIKNALAVGSDSIEYSIKTSFLAFLAHRMLSDNETRIPLSTCADIYSEFSAEYALTIGFDTVMNALQKSRILLQFDDKVEFRYDYCFYYFVALYLTKNLERRDIRETIGRLADDIFEERNANIFLFLAHLSENSFILDQMLQCADGMFGDMPLATLEEDVEFLGESGESLLGPEFWDVGEIRELRRIAMDRRDRRTAEGQEIEASLSSLDDYSATQEHVRKLGAAFKTLQILGQVLKNFPAAIRAERKEQIAAAAYGVALRALSDVLKLLRHNQGDIVVAFMQQHMEDGEASGYVEAFERARASVAGWTRLVSYGAVARIVNALGGAREPSPSLSVRKVAETLGSPIARLTVFGMELDYAKGLPQREMKKLHRMIRSNPVARSVLQALVIRHMHLFEVPYKAREKACAELGIKYKRLQLAAADPRRKLLGSGRNEARD